MIVICVGEKKTGIDGDLLVFLYTVNLVVEAVVTLPCPM
jgi:hypothetical protein